MKLLEDFMHWHLPWFKLVAVVVPYHHRVQVLLLQTRARIRLDVVHEREDALSLGSVERNEQHEDHKAERVTIAWVYLDTLDDLVGQAARRRKLKDHMEGISRFADVSARPAQSTRMEGASGGSLSEEEAQQP